MKKKIMACIGAFVALIIILPGCSSNNSTNAPYTTQPATPSSNNNPTMGSQSVSIKGFTFSPKELTISKGDTVTWTNEDTAVHNVVGGVLKSDDLAKGKSYSYTFTEAGTYDYVCTYHPAMKGKIIVK